MDLDKYWKRTVIIYGIILSVCIFLIGFLVMFVFWLNDIQDPDIPGFFFYKAATYGDGICLPLLTGCMTMYLLFGYRNMMEYIRQRKKISTIVGIVCTVIGIAVQYSWLASDEIGFNWTIPRLHYFTPAGWYHAFYFSFMFGLIGFFLTEVWLLKSNKKKKQRFEQAVCLMGVFSFGTGYMYLHAVDDWAPIYGREQSLWMTFIGMMVLLGGFIITADRDCRIWEDLKILFLSSCITCGIVISIEAYENVRLRYVGIAVIGMLLFWMWMRHKVEQKTYNKLYYCVSILSAFLMYLGLLSNYGIRIRTAVLILCVSFFLEKCI